MSRFLIFFLMTGGFISLITFVFIKLFGFLYYQQEFPYYFKLFLCEKILMMSFLTVLMMLILSAIISTLNIFFLSKDLHVLLASPLPARSVFAWKSIEVLVSSSLMVIFFSFPVLFSYAYYFAPRLVDILGIAFIFLLYMICGVCIGVIIGLIVPAYVSVKKLQPVLSVVSIIFISGIIVFLRLLKPEEFGNPAAIHNIMDYMAGFNVRGSAWFPFYWIARALRMLAESNYGDFFKEFLSFVGVILVFGAFIYFLQKKYYLRLFDKLSKDTSGGYHSSWKKTFLTFLSDGDYSALWKKEVKTFLRSPAQWSQLLIVGAIVIVYVLNIKGIPMPHPSVKHVIAYLNMGMAAFVVAGLSSRFTFPALPLESPGVIHLIVSPFSKEKVFRFKFVFYLIPQTLIGFILFLVGDAALGLDPFFRMTGFVFLAPVLPVITILALYFSLKVDDSVPLTPQHLLMSRGGIAFMLWSMGYILLAMVYFIRPVFLYYFHMYIREDIPFLEIAFWYGGFVIINLLFAILLYRRSLWIWKRKEIASPLV
ncbi:MAG: putative ABC transporter permease subunit [Candidatus Omnitrophota bacterium]